MKPIAKRFFAGVAAWWLVGIVTGICTAPNSDIVGLIAGAIGGIIVTSVIGVVCGLIGSQANETLLGAAAGGGIMASAAILVSAQSGAQLVALGLISGGLTGATFSSFLRFRNWIVALVSQHA